MNKKILIGCEESQAVTMEFRKLGFEAYSNDLKDCSGGYPEFHIKGDIMEAMYREKWDFIGLHPVCTKMTLSGNRHYAPGKPRYHERLEAVEWTIDLWKAAINVCDHVYMENPMGAMNSDNRLPKPQIIHPYYFGDQYMKQTCLWLHGLPKLVHIKENDLFDRKTHVSKGERTFFKSGKSHPKWYADAISLPKEQRSEVRSKSFPGIARAIAEQWSKILTLEESCQAAKTI